MKKNFKDYIDLMNKYVLLKAATVLLILAILLSFLKFINKVVKAVDYFTNEIVYNKEIETINN